MIYLLTSRPYYFAVLVFLGFIAGCQKTATEKSFANYHSRISNIYRIDTHLISPSRQELSFPPSRAIKYLAPSHKINLIEMLRLTRCHLSTAIASHNNGMSKFQGTEEQLFYDLEFIRLTPACLATLKNEDSALFQSLLQAQQSKLTNLPQTLFSAIFASEELQNFFSSHSKLADESLLNASTSTIEEEILWLLSFCEKVLNYQTEQPGDLNAQKQRFIQALRLIGQSKTAGRVLVSAQWYAENLNEININISRTNAVLCTLTPTGNTLLNNQQEKSVEYVFRKLYIEQQQRIFLALKRHIYPEFCHLV